MQQSQTKNPTCQRESIGWKGSLLTQTSPGTVFTSNASGSQSINQYLTSRCTDVRCVHVYCAGVNMCAHSFVSLLVSQISFLLYLAPHLAELSPLEQQDGSQQFHPHTRAVSHSLPGSGESRTRATGNVSVTSVTQVSGPTWTSDKAVLSWPGPGWEPASSPQTSIRFR